MKPEKRRQQILECAKKLFSTNGYYSTQISDIIREADIARGTVYQYFSNKDDIFITLLEDYYQKWQAMMTSWAERVSLATISPKEYLRERILINLQFFAQDADLCNILLRMGLGLPGHLDSVSRRFEERILAVTVNDLKLGLHNGHISPKLDIDLAAHLFTGALLQAAYAYFGRNADTREPVDVERAADQIAGIFADGIFA